MFDIGFSELFVIAVVALLVLGPERLPKAARFAGLWMRRARAQWYAVKSELEHELAAEELKRNLRETQDELREAHTRLQREGAALHEDIRSATRLDATPDAPGGQEDAAGETTAPTAAGAAAPDAVPPDAARLDAPPVRDER